MDFSSNRHFPELKLASRQYRSIRDAVQSMTTFASLQTWLNEHQFEVYAAPYNIMDERRYVSRYKRAKIVGVETAQVNHNFHHDLYFEEEVRGKGWEVEILFMVGTQRFDQLGLKIGLAAYGIYTYGIEYTTDEYNANCYRVSAYLLERDFKMTDGHKWKPKHRFNDEDEDENISAAEQKARWYEEGLLDDEIDGVVDGYR